MDYNKLVKTAGYKGEQGEYIARKIARKQIPAAKLNQLHQYFPRAGNLAGADLAELGNALFEAQQKLNEPSKPAAPKGKKEETAVSVESEDS